MFAVWSSELATIRDSKSGDNNNSTVIFPAPEPPADYLTLVYQHSFYSILWQNRTSSLTPE